MARRQDWIIIERLGDIILRNVDGHIFEIGVGFSTPIFSNLAADFDRNLYCFETNEKMCDLAKMFGATVFQGKSLANIEKLSETTIAMGLIDGRHRAGTVRAEISFFLKRLSPGGVIFLHDTYSCKSPILKSAKNFTEKMIGDVYKVRKELESLDTIQIFTWPYTAMNCGLSMVMKMDPDRPYYEM